MSGKPSKFGSIILYPLKNGFLVPQDDSHSEKYLTYSFLNFKVNWVLFYFLLTHFPSNYKIEFLDDIHHPQDHCLHNHQYICNNLSDHGLSTYFSIMDSRTVKSTILSHLRPKNSKVRIFEFLNQIENQPRYNRF